MDPESSREWTLFSRTVMVLHVVWRFMIAQKFSESVTAGSSEPVESSRLVTCLCAGIQDDPHVKVMMAGSTLRKVKSRSWKKQRHFRLLEDGQTIWYKSRWAGRGHSTCECRKIAQTWYLLFYPCDLPSQSQITQTILGSHSLKFLESIL